MDDELPEVEPPASTDNSSSLVSAEQLTLLAEKLEDKWESFALNQLGIETEEVDYIKMDKDTPLLRANHMLTLWKVRLAGS